MHHVVTNLCDFSKSHPEGIGELCVGKIVRLNSEGCAIVDFDKNPGDPVEARSIVTVPSTSGDINVTQLPVLLVFENKDPKRPIIIGFVNETLFPSPDHDGITLAIKRPDEAIIAGKRIVFNAEREIILRCGRSTLILKANGKVLIKGAEITSRASRTNKIKGTAVNIN